MTHITRSLVFVFVAVNLFSAFMLGVFFRGFDQAIFAPALISVLLSSLLLILPGFRSGWSIPRSMTALFLLLFWIWTGASILWSQVPYISILFALLIGSLPLLFFSIIQHDDAERMTRFFSSALTVAIGIVAVWALIQYFFLSGFTAMRINHPMLNANNLAVIIAMGFFLALGHLIQARKPVLKIALGILMVLMAGGVLVTQSRGGALGLILGSCFFAAFNFRMIRDSWRVWAVLLSAIVLFSILLILDMQHRYVDLHVLGGGDGQRSIDVRMVLWQASFRMFIDNLFPGIGLGVFYLVFPSYRHPDDISDGYFSHLDPLQFGIEMGFPAVVFFYGFCLCVLLRTLRALKKDDAMIRAAVSASFCGLLALLTNAHLNFDLYMLPAQMMGTVLLCQWYLATERSIGRERLVLSIRNRKHVAAIIPALALVYILSPLWVVQAGIAVKYSNDAMVEAQKGDLEGALQANSKSQNLGPESYYRSAYQKGFWTGQMLQKNFFSLSAERRADLYRQTIEELDRAIDMNPYYIQAMNYKAMIHFIAYPRIDQDGVEKAKKVIDQAYRIDPTNIDTMIGYARILESQGQIMQASKILESGQRWLVVQYYAPPFYDEYRARLRERLGDISGAAEIRAKMPGKAKNNQIRAERMTRFDNWIRMKWQEIKTGF